MPKIAKKTKIITVCLALIAVSGCKTEALRMNSISETKAIEIAKEEITNMGYEIAKMKMEISRHDTIFNKWLPEKSQSEYIAERQEKLKGKEYWAIYFYRKDNVLGGDVCIFVDTVTGEVLANYRGK